MRQAWSSRRRRTPLVVALAALLALAAARTGPASDAAGWCVAVWYPSSEHPAGADSIVANADVIDVVHPFWYTPDAAGGVLERRSAQAEAQLAAWRAAGLLVLPSIFSGIPQVIGPDLRASHVAAIVELVERNDYDGIDIDYEMFPLATRDDFSRFVEELAAELHARGRLLAVTVHAKSEDRPAAESAAAQDWQRLAAAADIFNLMTYDYTNRNEPPGPVTSNAWLEGVVAYAGTTTALAKVRAGLPFYGYSWTRGRPPARAFTYEAAARMVEQFSLPTHRDPLGHELVVELDAPGLPRQNVFVSDAQTTAARLELLPADLGGVAIWGLGGEDPRQWELLRARRPAPCGLR